MTHPNEPTRTDPQLIDLVDSVVAAIDIDRSAEIDRLREAFQMLDAAALFDDELRLNGTSSVDQEQTCFCEVWL